MNGDSLGNGASEKEFVEERVAYIIDANRPNAYAPRISVSKTTDRIGRAKVEKNFRPFETDDINRVLDFEQVPDPPPDGPMMHCEDNGPDGIAFPNRHFCLRGGFLFYFDLSDVSGTGQSHYISYHGPPLGVIPLDKVSIEFPAGGRRVFREHAHTDARTGYELVILHAPDEDKQEKSRPPCFLVAESLGLREKWSNALKARAKMEQPTLLRTIAFKGDTTDFPKPQTKGHGISSNDAEDKHDKKSSSKDKSSSKSRGTKRNEKLRKGKDDKGGPVEDAVVQEALAEFGKATFIEKAWIDNYFETHNDVDAPARCRQMEKWQEAIKRGLKAAVLEQYEYFVEASAEMTTMGREVVALKTLVETQVETIKEMKEIDFSSAIHENRDDGESDDDDMFDQSRPRKGGGRRRQNNSGSNQFGDDQSDVSSVSSFGGQSTQKDQAGSSNKPKFRDENSREGMITIPSYFDDVSEEIIAFVRECRYTDATDLWAKSKAELTEINTQHEEPTPNLLTRKQYNQVQNLFKSLEELAETTSDRLVETLRRKNEALKQASKRERADPMSQMAPSLSPCCLNDDMIPLKLLVKLGKTQEAATAYTARRSLLLLESLHERPISGTGSVDLVIYAAQLSQSFFSSLANAVEGFLDLFLSSVHKDETSLDESSIQSSMLGTRNLPAGALASIVLWCDDELAKFATAFGGTRVLGNLALSPPPRDSPKKKGPRVLGQSDEPSDTKDRMNAIDLASQCVSQAFQYASENLDTVGLPLTPRLAECLRTKLKGCEIEVADKLDDQWKHITLDWRMMEDFDDIPADERRALGPGFLGPEP